MRHNYELVIGGKTTGETVVLLPSTVFCHYYPMMYWAFWSIDWFTYWLFVSIFSYFADYFTFILQETGTCSILWNGGWCQQHQLQPQPQQSLQQPSQQQQQSLQQPSQPLLSTQHTTRHQQGRLKKKNPIGHESYKHLQKYKYCSKNPFFTNCFFRLTLRAFGKFLVCNVPVQYLASVQKAHTKDVKMAWLCESCLFQSFLLILCKGRCQKTIFTALKIY